ncbi:MAG: flavin reductase [Desulfobacteraceae bacterium]|nr:flavin reductase [Desulfobacteraceae bacterium]
MKHQWREAFGKMTYGIYVLTTGDGDVVNGMIASWVTQVSYDPPLILAAVHPHRYTHALLEKNRVFALHVLGRRQKDFLKRFKGPVASEKFTGVDWRSGDTGCPILKDCLAWFECRVQQHLQPGNHTLFFGEVVNSGSSSGNTPLSTLDYEGVYTGKN